jgi:hypothetical protein
MLPLRGTINPLGTTWQHAPAVELWWNPDGATPAEHTAAWQAKGVSLAASYLNLGALGNASIDPALVGGVAPTWDIVNGWSFDGVTQYLLAGLTPPNDQSWSAIVRFAAFPPGGFNGAIFGCGSVPGFKIYPRYGDATAYYDNGGEAGASNGITSGVLAIAGSRAYRNGLDEGVTIPSAAGVLAPIFIGAFNDSGPQCSPVAIQAIVFYDLTLTAPQVLARSNAMLAL